MAQATIPLDYDVLASNYPARLAKVGEFGGKLAHAELRKLMEDYPGTPCCVQVSHSINMAGHRIPSQIDGGRRKYAAWKIGGIVYYYILAVDEMEKYLADTFGDGELVRSETDKKLQRTSAQVKAVLKDRKGILVMRQGFAGIHTELWDGSAFHQKDMAVDALLTQPRVLFWECTTDAAT